MANSPHSSLWHSETEWDNGLYARLCHAFLVLLIELLYSVIRCYVKNIGLATCIEIALCQLFYTNYNDDDDDAQVL